MGRAASLNDAANSTGQIVSVIADNLPTRNLFRKCAEKIARVA